MQKMRLPIGISDFRELVIGRGVYGEPYLFVDKSLFIKNVLDKGAKVQLFTRPRRFGKTLNLSMLHYFFSKEVYGQSTDGLFDDLKINGSPEHMRYQGKYPVIFLTFKDVKRDSFEKAYGKIGDIIRESYGEHRALLESDKLYEDEKEKFENFLQQKCPQEQMQDALKTLTHYLHRHHGINPIVLIDEYDTPIQSAYLNGYYDEMIGFMRGFFGAGLKDNTYLEKAVLTGILRVSKENLFSGLNNLKVYSLLHKNCAEYFGFTEQEVEELLSKKQLSDNTPAVRDWYNGYQIGDQVIYNPWSVINYIEESGKLDSYWVHTSDNALIKKLIEKSSLTFKEQLEKLFAGTPVKKFIDENVVFDQLESNESNIWGLLLMSGYLKAKRFENEEENLSLYELDIPNKEVRSLYNRFISEWLSGTNDSFVFNQFIKDLLSGNIVDFESRLKAILLQTFSVHDVKGNQSEKFFHGFLLGLLVSVDQNQYIIDSNKEAGLGRYDLVIAPKDRKQLGIILELKSCDNANSLETTARKALEQIHEKKYEKTGLLGPTQDLLKIGVAFSGKELAMVYQKASQRES